MAEKEVDARGLPCPRPVMMTKKALDDLDEGIVRVLVTQEVQTRNVSQLARSEGLEVEVRTLEDYYEVLVHKTGGANLGKQEKTAPAKPQIQTSGAVLLLSSDKLGQGNDELGALLAELLVNTLAEIDVQPAKVLMLNEGVRLACRGSKVVSSLRKLAEDGVQILVCGTCLNFLGLLDELEVGEVSNMYDIAMALLTAQSIVAL
ncbi:MAG: sulfurtransferase-like selenium metabolism protein YedF [Armatimonadetes bacterium]|nr:sulfurtransferase-like selenium metabolism protein YedF [Armatimonadota bacterium]